MINAYHKGMKKLKNNFISGALVLSLGGLFAKILGALYRIPLTNIVGSYGMGLYQLVFPAYILFLTVAQAGVPVALSKLIAQNNQLNQAENGRKIFKVAFFSLLISGAVCAALLAALSGVISRLQGNANTASAFLVVAPALLFIPVTNVLKGYFQGNMNMVPSGVTTVIEQVVKLVVGLFAAYAAMPDVQKAVLGACLAITVSEFCSLAIMATVYVVHKKRNKLPRIVLNKADAGSAFSQIFSLAVPVALGAFVMQTSQVIDSVMVVNLLTVPGATEKYGLWTGPVNSMLGLPIALSGGVAVSALPGLTKAFYDDDKSQMQRSFNLAMKLTLVIALPCAFGLIALSEPILSLLYSGLPQSEIAVSATLLSLSGLSVVFLAVMQTAVSVCQAVGKPYASVVIISLAIVVKAVINLVLLPNPKVNIYGAAISETLCYLFATVCVIIYLKVKIGLKLDVGQSVVKPLAAGAAMSLIVTVAVVFAKKVFFTPLGTVALIVVAAVTYFAAVSWLKTFSKADATDAGK